MVKYRLTAGLVIVSEMMKESGGFVTWWMIDIINNVCTGVGNDPRVCGTYSVIELLAQPINLIERVLENRTNHYGAIVMT